HARNTLAEHIDIRFTERGADFLRATMPVNPHTHQPSGVLHGGASVALAETVGSVAANLCVDRATQICLGQVWHIEIRDEQDKLVCVSRLTMAVVPRKPREAAGK